METLFFILGIASVVVIAIAIVAVVSIVKVTRLSTTVREDREGLHHSIEDVHRQLDYKAEQLDTRVSREIEQVFHRLDEVDRYFTSQLDSRLDKLESKLLNNIKK